MKKNVRLIKHIDTKHGETLPCFVLSCCTSTNVVAKQAVQDLYSPDSTATHGKNGPQSVKVKGLPFAICAREQSEGRGRLTRSFLSLRDKGAYVTLVLPFTDYTKLPLLSCICAITVRELLAERGIGCTLKWPNDVLFCKKKICGILCQSGQIGDQRYAILGIGVNLNYTEVDFGELHDKATSLLLLTGEKSDCIKFSIQLAKRIFCAVNDCKRSDLIIQYCEHCSTIGKKITFMRDGQQVKGIATSICDDMSLAVVTEDKEVLTINYGEVNTQC